MLKKMKAIESGMSKKVCVYVVVCSSQMWV